MRISLSSEVIPEIREFERTSTTVANVYVQGCVERYLRELQARLEQLGYHGPLGPAARANAKAPGGRLVADAITRQLEVAELVLTGIDEVIPE